MTIVFDLETTGLPGPDGMPDDQQPHIIEFAAMKVDGDWNEVDRLELLINPWGAGKRGELPAIITKITGIAANRLYDKPDFAQVYQQLCEFFLGERRMLAHNCPFDCDVLSYNLGRIGKRLCFPWPQEHVCTVQATYHMENRRLSLADLHTKLFGSAHKDAHRAMVDVDALVRVCRALDDEGIIT
jgi:DNA polymerase III epsilon subunit-like protein